MDFRFTPEQEALQAAICEFLTQHVPEDHPEAHIAAELGTDEEFEFALGISKKLAERGWYTALWLEEHSGMELGSVEAHLLSEELGQHGVGIVNSIGMLVARLLMRYGTEEQRRRFLPGIANCEVIWGEGYSEPDAGSDLASLETTARRDGDEYVLNGTKVWTGAGHRSDWMFVFARTDPEAPKHRGISYLLIDMKTPGVTVVPLASLVDGLVTFAQEFFEDVRVPADNLVGEENTGWQQRLGIGGGGGPGPGPDSHSRIRRQLRQLTDYCKGPHAGDGRLGDNPLVRQKLAQLAVETEVSRVLTMRNASLEARGERSVTAAESLGVYNRELNQRLANTAMEVLGLYGPLLPTNERWAKLQGRFAMAYMYRVASTIYGGTTDIHRNILANRGLGLPRG